MLLMFQKTIALHHSSEVGESWPVRAGQEPAVRTILDRDGGKFKSKSVHLKQCCQRVLLFLFGPTFICWG